jgi:hypothetical protein
MTLTILTVLHVAGAAAGVGAATASDALFLRSIRNRTIGTDQFKLLKAASRVVLGGLSLVVLTGIALVTGNVELLANAYFQVKMIAVFLLIVNGLVFHTWMMTFLDRHRDTTLEPDVVGARLWGFAVSGAVSIVSWYGALILSVSAGFNLPFAILLGLYIAAVAAASVGAYVVLSYYTSRESQAEPAEGERRLHRGMGLGTVVILILLLLFIATIGALAP